MALSIKSFTGFETGTLAEVAGSGGNVEISTDHVHAGSYALRCYPSGAGGGYISYSSVGTQGQWVQGGGVTIYFSMYLYLHTLPTATEEVASVAIVSAATTLRLSSTGTLRTYDIDGVAEGTGPSAALETGKWYRIDWAVTKGAGQAAVLSIYDASGPSEPLIETIDTTGNHEDSASNLNYFYTGKKTDRNGSGYDIFFDDVWIDSGENRGKHRLLLAIPEADGSTMAWSSGSYADVDEAPPSDANYIAVTPVDTTPVVALFDLPSSTDLGLSGPIVAVRVFFRIAEQSDPTSFKLRMSSGANNYDSTAETTLTPSAYVTRIRRRLTDPAGAAWTTSVFDGLEVGVIAANTGEHRCSTVLAMVDFTPYECAGSGGIAFAGTATTSYEAGAGASTWTVTGSGGLAFAGTVSVARELVPVPAGGCAFAGSAELVREWVPPAAGAVVFAGTATTSYTSGLTKLYPTAVVDAGTYTRETGSSDPADLLAGVTSADSYYDRSVTRPSATVLKLAFDAVASRPGVALAYEYGKDAAAGERIDQTIELRKGGALVRGVTHEDVGVRPQTTSMDLSDLTLVGTYEVWLTDEEAV